MQPERSLTCAEVVELVTDYLEGRLDDRERRRFEEHVAGCDGCATYVDQMRATIVAAGRLREPGPPPELEQRLLDAFRGWRSPA